MRHLQNVVETTQRPVNPCYEMTLFTKKNILARVEMFDKDRNEECTYTNINIQSREMLMKSQLP